MCHIESYRTIWFLVSHTRKPPLCVCVYVRYLPIFRRFTDVATSSSSYYLLTSIDQYRCWWWGISLFTTKALASIGSKSITERLPSGLITLANYAASCLCITLSKMLLMASNTYQDPQLLRRTISAHSSFRIMHALKVPMKWLYRLAIDYQACELPCRACVTNMEFRYKI